MWITATAEVPEVVGGRGVKDVAVQSHLEREWAAHEDMPFERQHQFLPLSFLFAHLRTYACYFRGYVQLLDLLRMIRQL